MQDNLRQMSDWAWSEKWQVNFDACIVIHTCRNKMSWTGIKWWSYSWPFHFRGELLAMVDMSIRISALCSTEKTTTTKKEMLNKLRKRRKNTNMPLYKLIVCMWLHLVLCVHLWKALVTEVIPPDIKYA